MQKPTDSRLPYVGQAVTIRGVPQGESRRPRDLGTPSGGNGGTTQPAWPDVSKTSRGYRMPVGISAAVVLVMCVAGLGVVGTIVYRSSPQDSTGAPPTPGSPRPTVAESPGANPGAVPPPAASRAKVNDCLSITGPQSSPVIKIAPCGAGTYRVVKRFDRTSDTGVCKTVPEANFWYWWEDPTDSQRDFVLCLRK
jgi:hypothetical protein